MRFPYKVELLSPAGSKEALYGALSAGADAVYLGGERFGARAYAENFSKEEICRALRTAHVLGKKIYLTANVLTREDELEDLVNFVRELSDEGLDGVIVQDIGVLTALREACPDLPLHASTQMSVTSAEAVRYLRRLGVSRVVPARELSLSEIRMLREEDERYLSGKREYLSKEKESPALGEDAENPLGQKEAPIEIEAFIHGAMCYSYSGRCLMSSFLGGRSGNRGRCAGTCRLPHRILDASGRPVGPDAGKKEVYPLSMKDMCVLSILPELIDAGIHSFKIEGRMKKPVYAAGVTAVYRKYIDRCYDWMEKGRPGSWKVEKEDLDSLRALYIRTELGTGYYHMRNGRSLLTIGKPGYAGTDAALEEKISRKYLQGLPKRGITGKAIFRIGEPARMSVQAQEKAKVTVEGELVQAATGRPLDPAGLSERLRKTGDSLFFFEDMEIDADEGVFLPVSAVNSLRRDALARLEDLLASKKKRKDAGDLPGAGEKCLPAPPARAEKDGRDPSRDDQRAAGRSQVEGKEEKTGRPAELWALVSSREQLQAARGCGCACIIVDGNFEPFSGEIFSGEFFSGEIFSGEIFSGEKAQSLEKKTGKCRYLCALPPVFRVYDRGRIRRMVEEAAGKGFSGLLVRTLEELETVLEMRYDGEIVADASLYCWNSLSVRALAGDCQRIVSSFELTKEQIKSAAGDRMGRMVLPVYGRIPMMETAGCVRKTENLCLKNQAGREDPFFFLQDRRGKKLPVRCRCENCSNTIYNALPLSLHSFAGGRLYRDMAAHLCMFTTESARETETILRWFRALDRDPGKTGKMKGAPRPPFSEFTKGHYKTGAL